MLTIYIRFHKNHKKPISINATNESCNRINSKSRSRRIPSIYMLQTRKHMPHPKPKTWLEAIAHLIK